MGCCSETDILDQLTPRLRAEVIQVAHNDSVNLLQGLPLFEDLEESSLSKIIVALRSSFLPPDEVIFVRAEVGRSLYIIRKGVVAVRICYPLSPPRRAQPESCCVSENGAAALASTLRWHTPCVMPCILCKFEAHV